MGKTKMRIFAEIGFVLYSPLFLAVYFYAI
jgi:hypothetical protein